MRAFRSPFSDIDDMLPGQVYVVDSTGWGWLMLGVLFVLPFVIVAFIIKDYAAFVQSHPILFLVIALIISMLAAFVAVNRGKMSHKGIGFVGGILLFFSIFYVQIIYAVPYVRSEDKMFSAMFNLIIVTAIVIGAAIFICAMVSLWHNGIGYLVTGIVFLVIVALLAQPPKAYTWESLLHFYGF